MYTMYVFSFLRKVNYYNNREPAVVASIIPGVSTCSPPYGAFPMETTGAYGGLVTTATTLTSLLDSLAARPGTQRVLPPDLVTTMMQKPR